MRSSRRSNRARRANPDGRKAVHRTAVSRAGFLTCPVSGRHGQVRKPALHWHRRERQMWKRSKSKRPNAGAVLSHFCLLIFFFPYANAQTAGRPGAKRASQEKAKPSAQANAEFDRLVKLADEAREVSRLSEALDLYVKALRI